MIHFVCRELGEVGEDAVAGRIRLRTPPQGPSRRVPHQGLDRLELIRFLQIAQTISVHHGTLAYLLGINALRATETAAAWIEDYAETLRGHRMRCQCFE